MMLPSGLIASGISISPPLVNDRPKPRKAIIVPSVAMSELTLKNDDDQRVDGAKHKAGGERRAPARPRPGARCTRISRAKIAEAT